MTIMIERLARAIATAKTQWTMGDNPGDDFDAMVETHLAMPSLKPIVEAVLREMLDMSDVMEEAAAEQPCCGATSCAVNSYTAAIQAAIDEGGRVRL